MVTITILKKLAKKDDLVVIPRKEYEEFLQLKKIGTFRITASQKRALTQARNNFKLGKTLTIDELRKKLGFTN